MARIIFVMLLLQILFINSIFFNVGYAQFQTVQSAGNIEEQLNLAREIVKSVEKLCEDYFNSQISQPAPGYLRYLDKFNCFNIDYPSKWSVYNDSHFYNDSDNSQDVKLSDRSVNHSSIVAVYVRLAFKDITLEDVKNAITTGNYPPNLEMPVISYFYDSLFSYGNYVNNLPTLTAESDLSSGDYHDHRTLYVTIASHIMLVFIVVQNAADANPSILQNMIDSVHIMK